MVLRSPGVQVSVSTTIDTVSPIPSTVPLVVFATRSDKKQPDGATDAEGTQEAGVARTITSRKEMRELYGDPVFVTSGGLPVHGDETNEYGLHAVWSYLATGSLVYGLRADVDLGDLVATTEEPLRPPADATYWIESDEVVGGIFRRTTGGWEAVSFSVYLTAPGGGDGTAGDWAFDYSTTNGILKVKCDDNAWRAATTTNVTGQAIDGATATNWWIAEDAPMGAVTNDFWWKTTAASGGCDLGLKVYRASDDTWVDVEVERSATEPSSPAAGDVWEDISTTLTNGYRPLKIYDDGAFAALTYVVQATTPTRVPLDGALWYDDTYTDFAMYKESANAWVTIATTTSASPSATQKVISASAPETPSTGAFWIDTSAANLDNFPVVKRYTAAATWEEVTDSVRMDDDFQDPSSVANGSLWINTGDPDTRYVVKRWTDDYEPPIVASGGTAIETFDEDVNRRWAPNTTAFGRRSQREVVVRALQAAIADNDYIRSEAADFRLVACPGYPELYDDMSQLVTDVDDKAFFLADTPCRMKASGVASGAEVTADDWKNNAAGADVTGEQGFASSGVSTGALYYPWGMGTNSDGNDVMIPPSTIMLRTVLYNDQQAFPWYAPAFEQRGIVFNASGVGYLDSEGEFISTHLSQGQRDVLYDLNINPIAFFRDTGLRVWGQRTALGETGDPLNSINVARLRAEMVRVLQRAYRPFLGQLHNANTWRSAENLGLRYIASLISLQAIYDGAVRCDETNNTPDMIDANTLVVDIAIKPQRTIEWVYINLKLASTGEQLTR